MHLIRLLVICLACLAAALMPARAAICPMQAHAARMQAPAPQVPHHEHPCPAPMSCCVPVAVSRATPVVVLPRAASRQPQPRLLHDRVGDDAARPRPLRPPTTV